MTGKRMAAVLLFALGALIGASTKNNLWDGYPFWVWLLVLFFAIAICGAALEMAFRQDEQTRVMIRN